MPFQQNKHSHNTRRSRCRPAAARTPLFLRSTARFSAGDPRRPQQPHCTQHIHQYNAALVHAKPCQMRATFPAPVFRRGTPRPSPDPFPACSDPAHALFAPFLLLPYVGAPSAPPCVVCFSPLPSPCYPRSATPPALGHGLDCPPLLSALVCTVAHLCQHCAMQIGKVSNVEKGGGGGIQKGGSQAGLSRQDSQMGQQC